MFPPALAVLAVKFHRYRHGPHFARSLHGGRYNRLLCYHQSLLDVPHYGEQCQLKGDGSKQLPRQAVVVYHVSVFRGERERRRASAVRMAFNVAAALSRPTPTKLLAISVLLLSASWCNGKSPPIPRSN